MYDPIEYYFNRYNFKKEEIKEIIYGKRYVAVMLENGNIGVCATLGKKFKLKSKELYNIDLKNDRHRIVLNAYYNAILNYKNKFFDYGDLLEHINFELYNKIVMVGYFKPIVEKLDKKKINLNIFDLRNKEVSIDIKKENEYLNKCDAAIVTATSIFNNTFEKIYKNTKGKIYILGPSSVMNGYFFKYKKIESIFGSIFNKYDKNVLEIIKKDLGTRHFLKLGQKVVLKREKNGN